MFLFQYILYFLCNEILYLFNNTISHSLGMHGVHHKAWLVDYVVGTR